MQRHPEPGSEEALAEAAREALERMSRSDMKMHEKLRDEQDRREKEALRLYEPTDFQERYHAAVAKEAIITAGNQCGKSLAGFVEDARAATNQDPHHKYPKKGVLAIVGFKEDHISKVIYPYLFKPGAFQIFKDTDGKWHPYKPWVHTHLIEGEDTEDAPPLIPQRFIEEFVWERRGKNVFGTVTLTTGWTIYAFTSRAEPSQGWKADLFHFDEDLEREDWYDEAVGRLTMRNGKLRWTALPHGGNNALTDMLERAEDEEGKEKPSAVAIHATIWDNPYMTEEVRQENCKIWKKMGEDVYRKRALGELTTDQIKMYPSYSKFLHDARLPGDQMSEARRIFMERANEGLDPPDDWMRVMVLDPGHKMLAVTWFAVPPPSLGFEKFAFNSLAIRNATALSLAKGVAEETRSKPRCQRWIIDAHGGALTSLASGIAPRVSYSKELAKKGCECIETGNGFRNGSDDTAGRRLALRNWFAINDVTGEPTLFIDLQRCERLAVTLPRYSKKIVGGLIQDEPNTRTEHDHIDTCEYFAADGGRYIKPPTGAVKITRAGQMLKAIKERQQRRASKNWRPGAAGSISLGPVN